MSAPFTYSMLIREHHLDTFGHVNNATYLEILEEARWEWLTQGGFGHDEILAGGLGPVILEITIAFRRELRLRTSIVITSWIESYESKVGTLKQEIKTSDGTIACTASMKFGLFDLKARNLVPPTSEWLSAIGFRVSE